MAENTFQVSSKLNDGRIFVIGGQTYDDFKKNLESALGIIPAEEVLSTSPETTLPAQAEQAPARQEEGKSIPASSAASRIY